LRKISNKLKGKEKNKTSEEKKQKFSELGKGRGA